jgi:hypothetical protein
VHLHRVIVQPGVSQRECEGKTESQGSQNGTECPLCLQMTVMRSCDGGRAGEPRAHRNRILPSESNGIKKHRG